MGKHEDHAFPIAKISNSNFLWVLSEREAEILKPLSSVEVVEKEEANFDSEISEDDVAGEWKLKGQVLARSPVRYLTMLCLRVNYWR